ncbi:MAG: sigma-70 family RNA polymerase sigma factor [Planctomycetota bacterium]|nr:MAG: sigma-70 family RNA polymerase sigma factor [Planctomycetota bacterium]
MAARSSELDPERLLANAAWVRGLAWSLLHDADLADDAVQDTWTRALQRPPHSPAALGSWLSQVLRSTAFLGRRAAARRRRREQRAARAEAVPSAADIAVQMEAHRALAQAVLSLPEGQRTLVHLRFYEGLPPREIAKRLDIPSRAVHDGLYRTLQALRMELQSRGDGGWERSCRALLAPAASAPPAWMSAAAALSTTRAAAVAAALILALAALWTLVPNGPAGSPAHDDRGATAIAPASDGRDSGGPPAETLARRRERAPEPGGSPSIARSILGNWISGTVSDLQGNPVAGARIDWAGARAISGPDGSYELMLSPSAERLQAFAVSAPGYTTLVGSLETGANQFEVRIPPSRPYRVQIVDPQGRGIAGARVRTLVAPATWLGQVLPGDLAREMQDQVFHTDDLGHAKLPSFPSHADLTWSHAVNGAAIHVSADGYGDFVEDNIGRWDAYEDKPQVIEIAPSNELEIQVVDPDGRSVAGAVCDLHRLDVIRLVTGPEGSARTPWDTRLSFELRVDHPQLGRWFSASFIEAATGQPLTVRLPGVRSVKGSVHAQDPSDLRRLRVAEAMLEYLDPAVRRWTDAGIARAGFPSEWLQWPCAGQAVAVDADGSFELKARLGGEGHGIVVFTEPGRAIVAVARLQGTEPLRIEVPDLGRVFGAARLPEGTPPRQLLLHWKWPPEGGAYVPLDAGGEYEAWLPLGQQRAVLHGLAGQDFVRTIELADQETRIDFDLTGSRRLRGVVMAGDQPVASRQLRARWQDSVGGGYATALTDAAGRFEFPGVGKAAVHLSAGAELRGPAAKPKGDLLVVPPDLHDVVVPWPMGRVHVQMRGVPGVPRQVRLVLGSGSAGDTTVSSHGGLELELPANDYKVQVTGGSRWEPESISVREGDQEIELRERPTAWLQVAKDSASGPWEMPRMDLELRLVAPDGGESTEHFDASDRQFLENGRQVGAQQAIAPGAWQVRLELKSAGDGEGTRARKLLLWQGEVDLRHLDALRLYVSAGDPVAIVRHELLRTQ